MHLTQESSTSSQYTITQSCVAYRLTMSSPPGQPDHTPTRVGVPCVPPHSTYLPRSMNTHSLCTQNALHSPAIVQITLAGSLPVTQKSTIPLGSETTRAGIAAWRICRYNLDIVPPRHTNKAVEAGVQTSCPFQYNVPFSFMSVNHLAEPWQCPISGEFRLLNHIISLLCLPMLPQLCLH